MKNQIKFEKSKKKSNLSAYKFWGNSFLRRGKCGKRGKTSFYSS
jgi:hypothetical protein